MSNKKNDNYDLPDNYIDEDIFNDIESDDFNDLDESNLNDINLSHLNDDYQENNDDVSEDLLGKEHNDSKKENIIEDSIEDFNENDMTHQSLKDLYEENGVETESEDSEFTDDDIKSMRTTPGLDELDDNQEDEETDDYDDDLLEEENTVLPIEADLLDEKFDDNIEEDMYSIQDQMLLNTQAASNYIPPSGINLIDKPDDNVDEVKTGPGTIGNAIKVFGISCLGVATLFLAGIGGVLYADYNKTPETIAAENNSNASQGTGDSISDISNQLSENSSDNTSSSSENSSEQDDSPIISENDSEITYRVSSQGDVDAASVSYIEGKGDAKQQNGIDLPNWEKTVAVDNSSQPYIGISWTGGGTINCEIIKDGQNVGTQGEVTSLADDKTVACQ